MPGQKRDRRRELCAEPRLAAVPDLYVGTAQAAAARDTSFGEVRRLPESGRTVLNPG
jgi:hypothetical protein